MPIDREVSLPLGSSASNADPRPAERAEFAALRHHAAALLDHEAPDIASRWEAQVRALLPEPSREPDAAAGPDRSAQAAALVRSLATSLGSGGRAADDTVALGLAFGSAAFGVGAVLHQLLRALELLEAMCLYAIEGAVPRDENHSATFADGVRLCRRFQQATATLMLAAARGYSQASASATQERFRRLRHDLRNPLSTIRSALELMADESVPEEARRSPRFRAMIERNAAVLDRMIVSRLGDAEARLPAGTYQRIAPRLVACTVRRDLRAEADARGVSVVVDNAGGPVRVDAAGLELLLHDVLLAALHGAQAGDVLRVSFPEAAPGRTAVTLSSEPRREPVLGVAVREQVTTLATALGAWLEIGPDRATLTFPVAPEESSVAESGAGVARSESRHDVAGARQRDDRQAGSL